MQGDAACVVDAFLSEGPKVLVRFGLGLLRLTKRRLKRCAGPPEGVRDVLLSWLRAPKDATAATAAGFQQAYSFGLLRVRACMVTARVRTPTHPPNPCSQTAAFESFPRLSRTTYRSLMGAHLARGVTGGAPASPTWHNPKIIGISSRLADVMLEAPDAGRLRACVQRARETPLDGLFECVDGAAPPAPLSAGPGKARPDSPPPAWLAGVYGVTEMHKAVVGADVGVLSATPLLAALASLLPSRVSHHNWARVYSTDLNGRSLDMLLRRVGGGAPALVVMQARILCVCYDCPSMSSSAFLPCSCTLAAYPQQNLSSWASIPRSACPWLVASPPGVVGRVIHRLGWAAATILCFSCRRLCNSFKSTPLNPTALDLRQLTALARFRRRCVSKAAILAASLVVQVTARGSCYQRVIFSCARPTS